MSRFCIALRSGVAALGLAGAALTACAPPPGTLAMPFDPPPARGYVIEPIVLTHEAHFAPGSSTLDAGEIARFRSFAASSRLDHAVALRIDGGGAFAEARRRAVLDLVRQRGPEPRVKPGEGGGADDLVTIVAEFSVILPEACLQKESWADARLLPSGCANALNLANAVEDTDDLFRGRAMGPAFADPVARAAERYLEIGGEGTALGKTAAERGAAYGYPPGTVPRFTAGGLQVEPVESTRTPPPPAPASTPESSAAPAPALLPGTPGTQTGPNGLNAPPYTPTPAPMTGH